MRLFYYLDDLRRFLKPLHKGIIVERAKTARECSLLRRGQFLVTDKQDLVIEKRLMNRIINFVSEISC